MDEIYMKEALKQAKKAAAIGEVPIGCVIVYNDSIIARGYNKRNTKKTTLAHAEMIAIEKASKRLGDWRLEGCTMYVTLEPCQMCSGAIVQSRLDKVVIGSMNPKAGCAGSVCNLLQMQEFNHQVELITGVLEEECTNLLQSFFKELREQKKKEKLQNKDK
ncbi:tRNA adenosine(34) deaminase TadA [Clostridium sp. Marseille-P299]|uniref:tRNA adenosine(34) deaminase TadA n=1 Tax=Clostridium sp. Marseille-P299 TaxID=1805477 RepID=UPI00082B1397|nr:tRNA adenosine(34) deaminase TadA [Clostridium sp. Marseille-P299]